MDAQEYIKYNSDEVGCLHPIESIVIADDNTGAFCRECRSWISVTSVAASVEIAKFREALEMTRSQLIELSNKLHGDTKKAPIFVQHAIHFTGRS